MHNKNAYLGVDILKTRFAITGFPGVSSRGRFSVTDSQGMSSNDRSASDILATSSSLRPVSSDLACTYLVFLGNNNQ